jgi:hypothetical protein
VAEILRRAALVAAGGSLVVVGLLLLVLPGPGLVVMALGLGLLSRDVPMARRGLERVHGRLPAGADGEVAIWFVVLSSLLAAASLLGSVTWLVLR